MTSTVSVSKLLRFLSGVLFFMFAVCLLSQIVGWTTGHWRFFGLTRLMDLGSDTAAPTWFNSFEWALVSLVCWVLSRHTGQKNSVSGAGHWLFLSAISLVLSVDEVACMHESLGRFLTGKFHTHGLFYYGFVLPGIILALGMFLIFVKFLMRLPKKTAWGMVLAGFLFVFGAAFLDGLAGAIAERHGENYWACLLLSDFEELFEMGSLILLLKVLLEYLRALQKNHHFEWRLDVRA